MEDLDSDILALPVGQRSIPASFPVHLSLCSPCIAINQLRSISLINLGCCRHCMLNTWPCMYRIAQSRHVMVDVNIIFQ